MGKENPQEPAYPESVRERRKVKRGTNPTAKSKVGGQSPDNQATDARLAVKQQMRPEEERSLANIKKTSKARVQLPATISSDDPMKDTGTPHKKGNLQTRARVAKRHTRLKGWPHPEGIHRGIGGKAPVPSKGGKYPRTLVPEKGNPTRRRITKPARRRESLRYDRRLKNTALT